MTEIDAGALEAARRIAEYDPPDLVHLDSAREIQSIARALISSQQAAEDAGLPEPSSASTTNSSLPGWNEAIEEAAKPVDARYQIAEAMGDDHGMRICTGLSVAIRSLKSPAVRGGRG